jgi:aminoacrylate hydrolase
MAKRIDMILASDQRPKLHAIDRPTLVLAGTKDACTPPYYSENLAQLIPNAELAFVEGGHLVYYEKPEEFYARVREFICRH